MASELSAKPLMDEQRPGNAVLLSSACSAEAQVVVVIEDSAVWCHKICPLIGHIAVINDGGNAVVGNRVGASWAAALTMQSAKHTVDTTDDARCALKTSRLSGPGMLNLSGLTPCAEPAIGSKSTDSRRDKPTLPIMSERAHAA